jgi:hypothetical protein
MTGNLCGEVETEARSFSSGRGECFPRISVTSSTTCSNDTDRASSNLVYSFDATKTTLAESRKGKLVLAHFQRSMDVRDLVLSFKVNFCK